MDPLEKIVDLRRIYFCGVIKKNEKQKNLFWSFTISQYLAPAVPEDSKEAKHRAHCD